MVDFYQKKIVHQSHYPLIVTLFESERGLELGRRQSIHLEICTINVNDDHKIPKGINLNNPRCQPGANERGDLNPEGVKESYYDWCCLF